jgi:AMP-binding enzyme
MILGDNARAAGTAATLDDLFRRAGVRHPDALALADPPNRESFADQAPRALSFAQADRAISAFAARLRGLGLQTDSVVAIHLPNTAESIVAFMGVLRAGMIAVPLPLLWRQAEIAAALGPVGAKAIVTCSRVGTFAHAEVAMQSAVELFSIRHVCGFGHDLPDGIVPLDDIFASDSAEVVAAPTRPGPAAAHVAAITFNLGPDGLVPIARSHVELVAGGLEIFLETGAAIETPLLSTIPVASFAGIALTVMPWLLCGDALHLHHSFDPDAFAAQCHKVADGTLVLPAAVVPAIAGTGFLNPMQTTVALWRAPERFPAAKTWAGPSVLVDVASLGEIGVVAARRGENGLPAPIPLGVVNSPRRVSGAPAVIETSRTSAGTLALRGRMVPTQALPSRTGNGQPSYSGPEGAGYIDTGFACRPGRDAQTLIITAPPSGTLNVGGYCFRQSEVDALVARADPDATIVALPDSDLGHRLAGAAPDRVALRAGLRARGVNPLLLGAFQPRGAPEAA